MLHVSFLEEYDQHHELWFKILNSLVQVPKFGRIENEEPACDLELSVLVQKYD